MSHVQEQIAEKDQLFRDLFSGKVPKRVPVSSPATIEFVIQYAGLNMAEAQWELSLLEPAYDKFCQDFIVDANPVGCNRFPSYYQILGSRPIVMSTKGFLQHPEIEGMYPEDYDAFIEAPFDFIVETILPRLYTELDAEPSKKAVVFAKAMRARFEDQTQFGMIAAKMGQKYGYSGVGMVSTEAPFDFMADFLRGFKGISGDVRRYPDKVEAACEAVLPLMIKKGIPPVNNGLRYTHIPLHMAPYMREKDFARFYWPTFKTLVEKLAEKGIPILLFVENDWMRYLDYLYELPENTCMRFEFGDPKLVKEKLGKKHIISGFYPITLLKTGTKEQCVDKAKELMEILAPGGRYWWNTDKNLMELDEEGRVAENLRAVLEYVHENGKY